MSFIETKTIKTLNSRALQQHLFSLLQNCKTTRNLIQIHSQIITNGFSQKNYILAKLISFCIDSGELKHAYKTFQHIKIPSTNLWNQIIRGYAAQSENAKKRSIELFNQMEREEGKADEFTYSFLLGACTNPLFLREGEQIHGRILTNGLCSNLYLQTNLINMYAFVDEKIGLKKAHQVFDEMTERSLVTWNSMLGIYLRSGKLDEAQNLFDKMPERNVVSWTTMISSCSQNGRCKQALALFNEMRRARIELDQVAMVSALSACAELGDLKLGRWIHSYIDECPKFSKQSRSVNLNNAVIHMYASCGVIEEAYKVFEEMKHKNVVSWTTMITGFGKQGYGEKAIEVFKWMQNVGVKPDDITFLGLLSACNYAGMVKEGRHYFDYMIQSCKIEPKIEHYGCMVDLMSRAGLLEEAQKLVETIPLKANDVLWGALLGGCRIHKNTELASYVENQLEVELDSERASGYLVLLSNVYAAAKKWDKVASIRGRMVEMGVKKPAGRSWVQVNGIIHDFIAGDWTHKNVFDIYDMVEELMVHVQLENDTVESTLAMDSPL